MLNCLCVALGGAVGSVLRYLIGLIPLHEKWLFPVKTFSINVLGCLLIGLVVVISTRTQVSPKFILFFKVGLCGGFTTYSTFALETSALLKSGHWEIAASYVLLSLAAGVGAVLLGEWLLRE